MTLGTRVRHRMQYVLLRGQYWDTRGCLWLNRLSLRQTVLYPFKVVSVLGDGWIWIGLCLGLWWHLGLAAGPEVAQAAATSLIGYVIYKPLKTRTVRPRPYQVHQAIILGHQPLDHFSFPSGHTLHAVLFTLMLGQLYPPLLWFLVPFAILIALSRMILGLHYPSDVLAGGILGAVLALISDYLFG